MTTSLSSVSGNAYLNVTNDAWRRLLELGASYGWQPCGTIWHDPETGDLDPEWGGYYCSNDFQIVTAEDAAGLGAALSRALDDIPDVDAISHKLIAIKLHDGSTTHGIPENAQINPFEYFSGKAKNIIRTMIEICNAGAFQIT